MTIPSNTIATLRVPAGHITDILESGRPATHARGVTFLRMDKNRAVFRVDSGRYEFVSKRYQGN